MAQAPFDTDGQRAEFSRKWSEIVAQAWADDAVRARLLSDPATVMREHGIAVPPGARVRVTEQEPDVLYLFLPHKPQARELSEADLAHVAGGVKRSGGWGSIQTLTLTASQSYY